jgi:hypothetical protein
MIEVYGAPITDADVFQDRRSSHRHLLKAHGFVFLEISGCRNKGSTRCALLFVKIAVDQIRRRSSALVNQKLDAVLLLRAR